MRNEFTAIYELDDSGDGPRYIAYCVEIAGANVEGKTLDEAREKLTESIKRALQARREETLRDFLFDLQPDAKQEVIAVQETISLY